jgi:galactokinase
VNPPTSSIIASQFQQSFGRAPAVIARAPGRIEFIGNHTDYNGGAVLGAAIDRYVWAAAAASPPTSPGAGRMRFFSANSGSALELAVDAGARLTGSDSWVNYPLGVWRSLEDFKLPRPAGFDLLIDSSLPAGAGLSSSAALELASALAFLALAGAAISPAQLAALGRHAENRYVGVPCGILDQGTSAFGRAGQLVHIDCRGPQFSTVPLPPSAHFWVFNTREKHALIDGLYAARHRECMDAATALGVGLLADLSPARFLALENKLTPVLAHRARHVVEENARVHDTVAALQRGDLAAVGRLLTASHRSSQFLFENSTPALDQLVDLLSVHPAVYGARLTGGGFGGAVLALTKDSFTAQDAQALLGHYTAGPGGAPEVLHLQSADGARIISQ